MKIKTKNDIAPYTPEYWEFLENFSKGFKIPFYFSYDPLGDNTWKHIVSDKPIDNIQRKLFKAKK